MSAAAPSAANRCRTHHSRYCIRSSEILLNYRQFRVRPDRIRPGINKDPSVLHPHVERRNLLGKRRRRCTRVWQILVTVPRTGNAAVDDPAFAEGTILVLADV